MVRGALGWQCPPPWAPPPWAPPPSPTETSAKGAVTDRAGLEWGLQAEEAGPLLKTPRWGGCRWLPSPSHKAPLLLAARCVSETRGGGSFPNCSFGASACPPRPSRGWRGLGALTRRVGGLEGAWLQASGGVWRTVFTRKEQKAGAVLAVWPDLPTTGLDGVWRPSRPVPSGTCLSVGDCHPRKPHLVASGVSPALLCWAQV